MTPTGVGTPQLNAGHASDLLDAAGPTWSAKKAVPLTLTIMAVPWIAAVVSVIVLQDFRAAISLSGVGMTSPWAWAATQRIVRFMLTGEIQEADRGRHLGGVGNALTGSVITGRP